MYLDYKAHNPKLHQLLKQNIHYMFQVLNEQMLDTKKKHLFFF